MNRKQLKILTLQFNKEIIDLYKKGIKVSDIAILKKITRARVYQILGLNKGK